MNRNQNLKPHENDKLYMSKVSGLQNPILLPQVQKHKLYLLRHYSSNAMLFVQVMYQKMILHKTLSVNQPHTQQILLLSQSAPATASFHSFLSHISLL